MRRFVFAALVLSLCAAPAAHAIGIGGGAFAGKAYPVLQDDTGSGTLFGARVPIALVPFVTVEPYWASSSLAGKAQDVAGMSYARQGFDETVYGGNVLLTMGGPLSVYPYAGYGQARLKRAAYDRTFTTYSAGVGIGVSPWPKISIDLRGEAQAIVDGETTRKFGNATAGVTMKLFHIL